jgi:serine/threonine-protein kinase
VTDERRNRAKAILRSVLARKPEERSRLLAEACRDDPTLLAEVEALYQSYEKLRSGIEKEGEAGRKIAKYEVLERVGQGAMGIVYKARDPLMRRIVGIKTMSAEIASDPELHERFYREARSAGNLSHRNIITIYDLGEDGQTPFIAMEFLVGEDLKTKLDRRPKLSLEERVRWMRETMEGLEHARGKDVIHRDIKPANIFITREGEVKILDFGLARLTSSVATKSGLVMGTPSYMSPEQVRGEKLDHRTDIFSAGATFYELLAYRKPFAGDSIQGVFYKILETASEPLREVSPSLPLELVEIVEKMMSKAREDRYASAGDVVSELRRLEAALPERKRALRMEAIEALGRVESLAARYREGLDREATLEALADERTVSLPIPGALPEEDAAEAPTLNELLPADYFGLVEVIGQARHDARRLEERIEKLEAARSLMAEASSLEAKGDLLGAFTRADEALRLVPAHGPAASYVDRLSSGLAARDPLWSRARVERLLQEAEARLAASDLAAAAERAERTLALDPGNEDALLLRRKVEAEAGREREKRSARERAARLVSAARAKLLQEDDPESCLALLSQALEHDPEDSDAQAMKEKAENRLAHLRSLALEETAAEAVAAATLAMRRGELDVAAREIARAMSASPEATEIPALTLLLERAKGDRERAEPTAAETPRGEEIPPTAKPRPRRPPAPPVERSPRATLSPWLLGAGVALAVAVGYIGWRATAPRDLAPEPAPPVPGSVPTTSAPAPSTSIAPVTSIEPATTTARPEPTSTAPRTSSVVSTVPSSSAVTTSSAPPSTTTTAAPTTATTSVEAPPVRPEDQIEDLLRRYQEAYESLDVNALGAVYPAVPLSVKNSFQNFKSLDLRMEPISGPEVSRTTAGPTATAVYRVVQTVEPKVGKTTVSRHRATFLFAGVGSAWIIVRVDFREE